MRKKNEQTKKTTKKKGTHIGSEHLPAFHLEFCLHRAASLVVATAYAPEFISVKLNENAEIQPPSDS